MESIPEILRGGSAIKTIAKEDEEIVSFNHKDDATRRPVNKCLGVEWRHENEKSFLTYYHWSAVSEEAINTAITSRRKISSSVPKCFDPLGLESPFVLPGKIALHHARKLKEGSWDSPIDINGITKKKKRLKKHFYILETISRKY